MLKNTADTFLFDKRKHSHIPDSYRLCVMNPQRNSLTFSDTYDESIVNTQIKEKINFLKTNGFVFDNICEIKCTPHTWVFKYEGAILKSFLETEFDFLINDDTLVYLYINDIMYKNNKMVDFIGNEKVYYNPLSFRQTDDSIKNELYSILSENVKSEKLYLIGGEMTFFAKLLKPKEFMMFTDFESIYEDAKINFPENENNIKLIKYNFSKLIKTDKNYTLIANTSRNGLDKNLCKEILELELKKIVIISCNKKSFIRDYNYIYNKYKITQIFDLNTNYTVSVYFLEIIA